MFRGRKSEELFRTNTPCVRIESAIDFSPATLSVSNHCTGTNVENVLIDRPVFADRPADTLNSSDLERNRLHVEATDPHSTVDFEAYCARTGHEIVGRHENDGILEFFIKRAENPVKI